MIVSITGVRRGGKSTLVKQLINHLIDKEKIEPKNILFLNLENPYFAPYAQDVRYLERVFDDYLKLANPKGAVYCFLDEVQFFKDWPIFLKGHYEQKRIKFVVTGSNSALLFSDSMSLLAGRVLPLEVFPLSFRERAKAKGLQIDDPVTRISLQQDLRRLLEDILIYGGFPEVVIGDHENISADILMSYAKSIIYQDAASRLQIRKPRELEKLFVYLVSNLAQPFSYHRLASLFSLSDKSLKEYLASLVDSYLIFELDRFAYSMKKQICSPKKVYSIDCGQANAIGFQFSANRGKLFENLLFLELRRLGDFVYYYKSDRDFEVDFLIQKGKQFGLLQVAWDISQKDTFDREIRALTHAMRELSVSQGFVITENDKAEIEVEGGVIRVLPAYGFLSLSAADQLDLVMVS